jgi:hypothetical protein
MIITLLNESFLYQLKYHSEFPNRVVTNLTTLVLLPAVFKAMARWEIAISYKCMSILKYHSWMVTQAT